MPVVCVKEIKEMKPHIYIYHIVPCLLAHDEDWCLAKWEANGSWFNESFYCIYEISRILLNPPLSVRTKNTWFWYPNEMLINSDFWSLTHKT